MRFIQIWILPDTPDLEPGVEQRIFTAEDRSNRLLRVIGPEGGEVVAIHQDASVHVAALDPGVEVIHEIEQGRGGYVYLIDGEATFDGEAVTTGDAAKVTDQPALVIRATTSSELILVDVPMRFTPVGIWAGRG
jgi:quercetin 2,3-dioxygenase